MSSPKRPAEEDRTRLRRRVLEKQSARLRGKSAPASEPPALDLDLLEQRLRQVLRGKLGKAPGSDDTGQKGSAIDRRQLEEAVRREVRRQLGVDVGERGRQASGRGGEIDRALLEGVVLRAIRRALGAPADKEGQETRPRRLSPSERLELEARVREEALRRLRPSSRKPSNDLFAGDAQIESSVLEARVREEVARQLVRMGLWRAPQRPQAKPKPLDLDLRLLSSQVRGVLARCLLEDPRIGGRLSDNDLDLIILAALEDLPVKDARTAGTRG